MTFDRLVTLMQAHVTDMCTGVKHLFEVELDKDELWNLYLDSFPAGTNEIYRKRREYDCSCCRQFIKQFGNVVTIKNGRMTTIWDFETDDPVFQPVLTALNEYVRGHAVSDVFFTTSPNIGTRYSYEATVAGIKTWNHFFVKLPADVLAPRGLLEGYFKNQHRTSHSVFYRSLKEITLDSLNVVLELIESNTLYRGEEWKEALTKFRSYKVEFDAVAEVNRGLYCWEESVKLPTVITHLCNHSIGTLLENISEGMDLDEAVRKYEAIVAPTNYKRPKAIFTKRMVQDAEKTISEMGYLDSLARRHARLDDISINNILFSNRDAAKRMTGNDPFADLLGQVATKPMNFDRVEEITADDFAKKILPTARDLEVYLENRHAKNMVSLIAPQNSEAPSMFKWNNNFGWAYSGNVTDSLKENVKAAGGKVDGVLRFSIQWNDGKEFDDNDVDAHCVTPRHHIYYNAKCDYLTGGQLDVDIRYPVEGKAAVENITWPSRRDMVPGVYQFFVECYAERGGRSGFRAEIEFDGQLYSFSYDKPLREDERIEVADVILSNDGKFTIHQHLDGLSTSREVWGLKTNEFAPVSVVMYSPNYWDEQEGIGHRHYFFMLANCHNPESPNGFYNEFLKNDLMKHKRVFEALGARMQVENSTDQLSGIGFSATKRDEVVVRVTGATKRMFKIKF